MHTIYLGQEEVDGYLRGFVARLGALGAPMPDLWCPIGPSGSVLASRLSEVDTNSVLGDRVRVLRLDYDRANDSVIFEGGEERAKQDVQGARVLVLDGSVHTGRTMHKVVQVVESLQPAAISCYALVLKSGSCMVPNTFGVMVGDHDRVFFQLASLPNNVVMPFGCLRSLAEADLPRPYIRTGIPEYDKWTWSDHWYDLQTNRNRRILVYEAGGRLCAVLSYDLLPADEIFVQLVAVDKATRGQGLGGHLLRWAETHGRATRCARVYLWADDRTVTFYEKMGYDRVSAHPMALDPGKYWKMARALIYSLPSGPNS